MSLREKALSEPARPEAIVFATIYMGDQIAELAKAVQNHTEAKAINVPVEPAKAAQKAKPSPVEITTDPVTEVEKGRSK